MYRLIRPALFALDAERAHGLALAVLGQCRGSAFPPDPVAAPGLAVRVAGIDFPNPVGIAAGLDKNGRAIEGLFALGVGALEIGTLTPLPQPGNPRPRMFRLSEDASVVNRLGFNNGGLAAALPRADRWRALRRRGRLGINVGANKDSADRIADYRAAVADAAPHADWVTINISSPNTPGLRDLQHGAALAELLAASAGARGTTALFLKIAPDLDRAAIDDIARAAIDAGVDALVVANTTIRRPATVRSRRAAEAGGLSGAALSEIAQATLVTARAATGGVIPLVAAGGIGSGAAAYARIRAGASLVQLYTALVYDGPGLPARIARDLSTLLARDGFASVSEAVGTG